MEALIEGFGPDAVALAALLAREGVSVRLAGAGRPGPAAEALREIGARVEGDVDLDREPGAADVAYLDPWTPEVAPRVLRLRAAGARISCLGDVLLERWEGPTVGITGTAGKTSTTALVAAALRAAGTDVAVSRGARAANLWPTGDLLEALAEGTATRTLVLELTSSHLAFMCRSPRVAAVSSFWPDHLELHGGLDRYRAAKETIARHQHAGDRAVLDVATALRFAAATPAEVWEISTLGPVSRGAYLDADRGIVVAAGGVEAALGHVEQHQPHPANAVAAAAIAAAAGATPDAIARGIAEAPPPVWRAQPAGTLRGVPVTDDGMAATPAKAAATLARHPDGSVVLLAGGLDHAGGDVVHAAPEERVLLDRALDEVARAARSVVLFGEAGSRIAGPLRDRGVAVTEVDGLAEAVAAAARLAPGAGAVVFSPLFPVSLDDRARFSRLVRAAR